MTAVYYGDTRDDALNAADDADRERHARLTAPGALAAAAAWYARQGIAIFPCGPRVKTPITRNGLKDATTDPDRVREWWTRTPAANIALVTGHHFDVIDVDGPTGWASYAELPTVPDLLAKVHTGGGGLHLYIPATGRGNAARLAPGIDYRGAGGYVLAPPSVHDSGRLYTWDPDGADALWAHVKDAA